MTIRVMPREFLQRSYLLTIYINLSRANYCKKAFGGRRRWASIYPFFKRSWNHPYHRITTIQVGGVGHLTAPLPALPLRSVAVKCRSPQRYAALTE